MSHVLFSLGTSNSLLRSPDSGVTWPKTGATATALSAMTPHTMGWGTLTAGMTTPDLFVGVNGDVGTANVWRSSDSGLTWVVKGTVSGYDGGKFHVNGTTLYLGTQRLAWKSTNNGDTWTCLPPAGGYSYYNGGWAPSVENILTTVSGGNLIATGIDAAIASSRFTGPPSQLIISDSAATNTATIGISGDPWGQQSGLYIAPQGTTNQWRGLTGVQSDSWMSITGAFTVGFWFRLSSTGTGTHTFFAKTVKKFNEWNNPFAGILIRTGVAAGVTQLHLGNCTGVNVYSQIVVTKPLQINEWHHMTAAWSVTGGQRRIYYDGVQLTAAPFNQILQSTASTSLTAGVWYVGRSGGSYDGLSGQMDDLVVFNRELTAAEIGGLTTSTFATQALTADGNLEMFHSFEQATTANVNTLTATNLFVCNTNYGVDRSSDGGLNWARAANQLYSQGAPCLVASGTILYAYTNGQGVWKSTNHGVTWASSSAGMAGGGVCLGHSIALAGSAIYAGQSNVSLKIYKSVDEGVNWTTCTGSAISGIAGTVAQGPESLMMIENTLYVATQANGIYKSLDGGDTWNPLAGENNGNYGFFGYLNEDGWTLTLTSSPSGSGSISSSPAGSTFPTGQSISLTAYPNQGFSFSAWAGALVSTANPATYETGGANASISAVFSPLPFLSGFNIKENRPAGTVYPHELYFEDCEFESSAGNDWNSGLFMWTYGNVNQFKDCIFIGQTFFHSKEPSQLATFEGCEFKGGGSMGGVGATAAGVSHEYRNCFFNNYKIATSLSGNNFTVHRISNSTIKNCTDFLNGAGARLVIENSTLLSDSSNIRFFNIDNLAKTLKMTNCSVLSGYLYSQGLTASPDIRLVNVTWRNLGNYCMSGNPIVPMLGNFTSDCLLGSGVVTASSSSFNWNEGVPI